MSGTKRMFEMTQRIAELYSDGKIFGEISHTIGDEFSIDMVLAQEITKSWYENRIMKNFSYDGDTSYGS